MIDLLPVPLGLSGPVALGLVSAALSVLAYAPYARDTLRGVTRPQRACWFIWSVLASLAFCALLHEGAGRALWFSGAQAGCTCVIFLLSLRHGEGRWITRGDGLVLCMAGLGLAAWAVTDSALYALAISITISLLGGSLTLRKAYDTPESETLTTWALSALAALCALAALPAWTPVEVAYPLYLLSLNSAIVVALLLGRQAKAAAIPANSHPDLHLRQPVTITAGGVSPLDRSPFARPNRRKRAS